MLKDNTEMEKAAYLPAQINKHVKKEGCYGRKPSLGWKCRVKVKVNNELESEIKSDYISANTTEITIGDGNWAVDKAIESCLETMHMNEESTFIVKLDENFELDIDISLHSCEEKGYVFEWSNNDKFKTCQTYKADGIDLFKNNRIEHAFFKFSKALKMLLLMDLDSPDGDCIQERNEILISLYNNLANCQLTFKNYLYVIELCNKSLRINPNVKGYFRRALAYIELKNYENAESDLLELLKIEPKNKAAIDKYKLVRNLDKQNRDNYEAIVKNMFR